jgi:hypothetical protein
MVQTERRLPGAAALDQRWMVAHDKWNTGDQVKNERPKIDDKPCPGLLSARRRPDFLTQKVGVPRPASEWGNPTCRGASGGGKAAKQSGRPAPEPQDYFKRGSFAP